MGQFASVDGMVRVVAAPGFHLTLTPASVDVAKGDLDMVARFKVGITRDAGLTAPGWLLIAGTSLGEFFYGGVSIMAEGKDYALVPAGATEVDLEFDMTGMNVIEMPFTVGIYENEPVAA